MGKEVRSVESYFRGENSQVVRRIWSAWFVNRGRDEMYEMVRGFLEHGRVDLDLLFEINFNNSPTEIVGTLIRHFSSRTLIAEPFLGKTVNIWEEMDEGRKSIITGGDKSIEGEYDRFAEKLEGKLNDSN